MKWKKEQFRLVDNLAALDMDFIVSSLQQTYWRKGASREVIERSFANSLCFGLFDGNKQIGITRVVTDKVIFSWICDVYIVPEYRAKGLGRWMLQCVLSHPDVALTRQVLGTNDAHPFYEKIGFNRCELMQKMPKKT